jgi:hypothetical protein
MAFGFTENEKFSLLAVNNCYTYVKEETELSDGTWVLPEMPTGVGDTWEKWIGTIRLEHLTRANFILVRRVASEKPGILDDEHDELFQETMTLFWLLQLSGIVMCGGASALQGSFERGEANIRQMVQVDEYYPTTGQPRYPVTLDRLEEAVKMKAVWEEMRANKTHDRFRRGAVILRGGFEGYHGQERIRDFVRAIEGLIRPDPGKTGKQFKNRAQTLGVKSNASGDVLYDAYQMRCDVEHVHVPDRYLSEKYPENQRDAIATMRTRQMETLASESYRRIFLNEGVRAHFKTDDALNAFWALPYAEQRKIWGEGVDVTAFKEDDEFQEKKRQILERHK